MYVESWYGLRMATKTKAPGHSVTYILGRSRFARISEVEGIRPSESLRVDFADFDRRGLSAAERRRLLTRKYAVRS